MFWNQNMQIDWHIKQPHTLNKKSLNGPGKSMATVLQKKFLVQPRNCHDFATTVFSWVNLEIFMSSFQQAKTVKVRLEGTSLV